MTEHKIPGGNAKGTPIGEADEKDLSYWSKRIGDDLEAGKARNPDRDRPLHAALVEELKARRAGKAPATSSQSNGGPGRSTALATMEKAKEITGSYRDAEAITKHLERAAAQFHLVAPMPACARLPEGCSVAFSAMMIHKEDCYDVGAGKFAPSKTALQKIFVSAGVDWDPQQSGRLDDSSDPHYCNWQAVGWLPQFDGTNRRIVGCKEMDMREGSAQVTTLSEKAREKDRSPDKQIREMRLHIQAHAETKAQLRSGRSIGIKSAYTLDELKKPFIVAKLMWTGHSDNPALAEKFALMQADAMLGGKRALYGEAPAVNPPAAALPKQAPPPVSDSRRDDDYDMDAPADTGEPVDERQGDMEY